jgi:hypothetical protein
MKPLLIILALLVTATSANAQTRWALPANVRVAVVALDAKEQQQVAEAVASWQPFLPAGLTLTYAGEVPAIQPCYGCVTITHGATPGQHRGETTAYSHDGLTDYAIIRIDPRAKFRNAVEHEIGHALGLMAHYAKSVMQEKESGRRPAGIDGDQLRIVYQSKMAQTQVYAEPTPPVAIAIEQTLSPQPTDDSGLERYSFHRVVTITRGNDRGSADREGEKHRQRLLAALPTVSYCPLPATT